jgi:hypothetical protein
MSLNVQVESPKTQSIDAIKALLQWKGRSSNPLPSFVELGKEEARVILVLSNKRDSYYCTTATKCSCPAAVYHHGPCKHQRRYFPQTEAAKPVSSSEPLIQRGGFRPVDTLPHEERAATAASPLYVDTTHDTTSREVAYHSIQEDKILWPAEA